MVDTGDVFEVGDLARSVYPNSHREKKVYFQVSTPVITRLPSFGCGEEKC